MCRVSQQETICREFPRNVMDEVMFFCHHVGRIFENQNNRPATSHQPQKQKYKMNYFDSLDPPCCKRNMEKISVIGGVDPYVIENEKFNCNIENFPAVTYPDIVNYLMFGSRPPLQQTN